MSTFIESMADDGGDDDEDNEDDERIKWYEMGEDTDEGYSEHDDDSSEGEDSTNARLEIATPAISTNSTSEGLGSLHPPFAKIITNCINDVFNIPSPKDWQLLLIQAIVFNKNSNNLRALCIRRTGDGKSLPIQCAATMRRYITIVIVPLLSVGLDQASNVYYNCNKKASVYAEHLDSISEERDIIQMRHFLNTLQFKTASRVSIILYASPNTITSSRWGPTLKALISRNLIRFMVVDECHYVTSAGRCFRPEFHTSIRALIGRLWNKCPMLFCSATMNKCSIHHLSLMLHPQSPLSSSAKFMPDMGVDDPSLKLPLIDPLPTKFFTGIIWGNVGRQGINVNIEFTTDWVNSVKTNVVSYANNRCRVLGYCSSAMDAKDTVHPKVQKILRDAGITGDTVSLTGGDGIMMKAWLVDLFADKLKSDSCDILAIVGTSAVNCGISSNNLYYIFVKGHPRSFLELIQLLGRLKRGCGVRLMQDQIHIMLSVPNFISVFQSILQHDNENEMKRQLKELRIVTAILIDRQKCFVVATEEYYGTNSRDSNLNCNKMCPTCRGEKAKVVKRSFLVDHVEASVFDSGPVSIGKLCTKLMERKGSIWVARSVDVKTKDAHELVMSMWVHRIISITLSEASSKRDDTNYTKKDIVCSFEKKPADAILRMNHRDDACWKGIPHV